MRQHADIDPSVYVELETAYTDLLMARWTPMGPLQCPIVHLGLMVRQDLSRYAVGYHDILDQWTAQLSLN